MRNIDLWINGSYVGFQYRRQTHHAKKAAILIRVWHPLCFFYNGFFVTEFRAVYATIVWANWTQDVSAWSSQCVCNLFYFSKVPFHVAYYFISCFLAQAFDYIFIFFFVDKQARSIEQAIAFSCGQQCTLICEISRNEGVGNIIRLQALVRISTTNKSKSSKSDVVKNDISYLCVRLYFLSLNIFWRLRNPLHDILEHSWAK